MQTHKVIIQQQHISFFSTAALTLEEKMFDRGEGKLMVQAKPDEEMLFRPFGFSFIIKDRKSLNF